MFVLYIRDKLQTNRPDLVFVYIIALNPASNVLSFLTAELFVTAISQCLSLTLSGSIPNELWPYSNVVFSHFHPVKESCYY